jgi:PKD repeat protein
MPQKSTTHRILLLFLLLGSTIGLKAQTDTEFWFCAPEVNRIHFVTVGGTDGRMVYLRLTTESLPSTVTVDMPAQAGFPPIVVNIPANTTHTIDMGPYITDDINLPQSIETRLMWTETDPAPIPSYINRSTKGIYITATTPITAYYEISNPYNRDIIALKGRNGLGGEFYVPFQTTYQSYVTLAAYDVDYRPYSAFDVIATEDNTTIEVTPTQELFLYPDRTWPAMVPITITLNKGEVATFVPYKNIPKVYKAHDWNRLSGSYVRVLGGGDVAIISRDDLIFAFSNAVDYVTDQIIPIELTGTDYAIIRGHTKERPPPNPIDPNTEEYFYVVGTVDGTTIEVNGVPSGIVNRMETRSFVIPMANVITTIKTSERVYVWHVAGYGGQVGGAIIPTISRCTGSSQVAFNRTSADQILPHLGTIVTFDFDMNILVRTGAEGFFKLLDQDKNDVTHIVPGLNDPASFTTVPGYPEWRYARFRANAVIRNEPYLLINTWDIFHLGFLNGIHNGDAFYGYFSDFSDFNPSAYIVDTGAPGAKKCFGDSAQLYARGGPRYEWTPSDFLDNPFIPTPMARNVTRSIDYTVTVSGSCGFSAQRQVKVLVSDPVIPAFTTDVFEGCAPLTVNIINNSVGAARSYWDLNSDGDFDDPFEGLNNDPTFQVVFENKTNDTLRYEITLLAEDTDGFCPQVVSKTILVYPEIEADFSMNITDLDGCQPLDVGFINQSTGEIAGGFYFWDFGDGGSSSQENPSHIYQNVNAVPETFDVEMVLTDRFNFCRDTARASVIVQPFIQASFVIDETEGCSPFTVNVENDSRGGITSYSWDRDGDGVYDYTGSGDWSFTFTNSTMAPITRTIRLRVFNATGCMDYFERTITIYPAITADFDADVTNGCDPLAVQFNNLSTGNTGTWMWDFGDGGSSTAQHPARVFRNLTNPGDVVYQTRLVATSPFECRDTAYLNITVSPYLEAKFSFTGSEGCSPHQVNISNTSVGADLYFWDFGDGNNSVTSSASFNHTYVNLTGVTQTYTLRLRVENMEGCFDILERTVVVHPELTAAFTPIPASGCSPLSVSFTNNSVGATSYLWSFGDGGSSGLEDPVHAYPVNTSGGFVTYTAKLIATSAEFCRDSVEHVITVQQLVEAMFTVEEGEGCHPFTVTISNQSVGAVNYEWHFGDSSPVSNSPAATLTHTYLNTGLVTEDFELMLVVANAIGCRDTLRRTIRVHPQLTADFTPLPDAGCEPLNVSFTNNSINAATYLWDFGDGASSAEASPNHVYYNPGPGNLNRPVKLKAFSADGLCVDSLEMNVLVYPRVIADFTVSSGLGCNPHEVTFTNHSVGGSNYQWDFGDGTGLNTFTTDPVTHTFVNAGFLAVQDYEVTLRVESVAGCVSEIKKTVSVYPDIEAIFTPSETEGCHPLTVSFSNASEGAHAYFWNFGDGSSSEQENPSYTFTNTGTVDSVYRVWLHASSFSNECRDSVFVDITVHPLVRADFTVSGNLGCTPHEVTFTNTSVGGSDYQWDVGDGTIYNTNSSLPIAHTYTNSDFALIQEYEVALLVTSADGCTDERRRIVRVYPDISSDFSVDVDEGCQPLEVEFTNLSQGAGSYLWDFGNGSTSPQTNPIHVFTNTGSVDSVYRVMLITIAPNNVCRDTSYIDIRVHALVQAEFSFPGSLDCHPFDVNLYNTSVGGSRFLWDFGDGSDSITLNLDPFVHQFENPAFAGIQTYQIEMIAENYAGCQDTMRRDVRVYPDIRSLFSASVEEGCQPLQVDFTNHSEGAGTYIWNFGDGASSAASNPSHTFTNTGSTDSVYRVQLISVAPNNMCRDTFELDIRVHAIVKASFTTPASIQCSPFELSMINSSAGGTSYYWDFGDGITEVTHDLLPFNHTFVNPDFTNPQAFLVELVAENYAGCTDTARREVRVHPNILADFSASTLEGCHPLDVQFSNSSEGGLTYLWDFGDGASSNAISPAHTFTNFTDNPVTRTVKLTATSLYFCTSEMTLDIVIHPKPKARFELPQTIACPPFDAEIINTSLNADFYHWTFGDGSGLTVGDSDPFSHLFDNPDPVIREYEIKLIAESMFGCIDSVTHKISVYPAVAAGFASNTEGCHPLQVDFTNETTGALSYQWDFGNGQSSTVAHPTHVFLNTSVNDTTYFVRLLGTSQHGCTDEVTHGITVYPQPVAEFSVHRNFLTYPDTTFILTNNSNPGSWNYLWNFGDGITSPDQNPGSHAYFGWGQFTIGLWVTSAHCRDSVQHTVLIAPPPRLPHSIPYLRHVCRMPCNLSTVHSIAIRTSGSLMTGILPQILSLSIPLQVPVYTM